RREVEIHRGNPFSLPRSLFHLMTRRRAPSADASAGWCGMGSSYRIRAGGRHAHRDQPLTSHAPLPYIPVGFTDARRTLHHHERGDRMAPSQDTAREQALARLRSGQNALAEGQTERAAETLIEAEAMLRALNDAEHAGEARTALAETQRRNGALDQAVASYERAIEYFKAAGNAAREAGATLALGRVERALGQMERAWRRCC